MRRGYLDDPESGVPAMKLGDEAPTKPRRRWRLHYQFPGGYLTMRSFEIKVDAIKHLTRIQERGGRVMLEDRWNEM